MSEEISEPLVILTTPYTISADSKSKDYSYESLFAIYNSNSELPPAVRNALPEAAQTIWRKAFNAALEQYGNDTTAAKVAWSAVKKAGYKKKGEKWVKSEAVEEEADKVNEGVKAEEELKGGDEMSDVEKKEEIDAATPAQIVHKTPPKGYPKSRSQYADPKRYKYPLDTYKHVRAALAYWSKAANRRGYSPEEQRQIWRRILRACKKFGIKVSKKNLASAEEENAVPAEWIVAGKIYEDEERRIVEAVPFHSGVNKNGWELTPEAMHKMLKESIGKEVYWSHTDDPMCRDEAIGKVVDVIEAGDRDLIRFEITDEEAIFKIDSGQWDNIGVSIGAKAPVDSILCSECGKPFYECDEHPNAHKVVADGVVDHWAIVKNPAFEGARVVTDFLSSLNASYESSQSQAKGDDSSEEEEEDYIEIDPSADLIVELEKELGAEEKMDKAEVLASASFEELAELESVKNLIAERDSLKAKVEELSKKISEYEKAEKDKLIAEIKELDPEAKEEELAALDKEVLAKTLEITKRAVKVTAEKVKAEADSSNPVRPDVKDTGEKKPTQEELMKAYASEKMGIDVDKFLKSLAPE